jgi:hypothetical protein
MLKDDDSNDRKISFDGFFSPLLLITQTAWRI